MSKNELIKLKTNICILYKNILKAHYTYLKNSEMRVFGDYFVKSEFNLNYKNEDVEQLKLFINQ